MFRYTNPVGSKPASLLLLSASSVVPLAAQTSRFAATPPIVNFLSWRLAQVLAAPLEIIWDSYRPGWVIQNLA